MTSGGIRYTTSPNGRTQTPCCTNRARSASSLRRTSQLHDADRAFDAHVAYATEPAARVELTLELHSDCSDLR